jgi:hypothetical protein
MSDELRQKIDEAAAAHEARVAELYRPDGTPRHAEDEPAEILGASRERFHARLREIGPDIDARIAATEEAVIAVEHSDPATVLSAEELQRAAAARWIVSEDCEALPLGELGGRMQAALSGEDKVAQFLLARYAARRVGPPKLPDPYAEGAESTGEPEGAQEIRELSAKLEKKLRPHHEQELKAARQALEEARGARDYATIRKQGFRSVLERHQSQQYGYLDGAVRR